MSDKDELYKELGKLTVQEAERILQTLPDDAKLVEGTKVMSARELKQKFAVDDETKIKFAKKAIAFKMDLLLRKGE